MNMGARATIPSERSAPEYWPPGLAYVFAVVSTVAMLLARMGMGVMFAERPLLILFQLPIILSAYMGGLGPGLTATAVAAVIVDYFLIPPIYTFHIAYNHDFAQWGILIVNGALISLLSESLHRSRRQAEMSRLQHEKSEERFRRAMEATSDSLWDWDVAGGSVYYSPGYFHMLGYEPDGFAARTDAWLEMVHPDDRKRVLAANEACIRNDVPTFGVEFRMLSHDGTWRWILRRGKAVTQDADGRALRMIGTHIDITDHKHAEEAQRASEAKFRLAFQTSPDSINLSRVHDGMFLDANEGFTKTTGYTREEVIGKTSLELNIWDDPEDRRRLIAALEREGFVENMEARFRGKDGRIIIGLTSARVLRIDHEDVLFSITRDITERKLAEDALRESEERFSRFFRASPVCTSITRLSDGQFADVNDAFLGSFGYPREEVIGQNPSKLGIWACPEDRAKMIHMLQEQGAVQDLETRFRRKSGEIRDVSVSAEVIEVAGQQYILGLTHDITERRRAKEEKEKLEAQLSQAQKMESVGRLAGGVAHDFNNMLGVIIGRAEMAMGQDVSTDKLQHNLKEILKAGLRSADLTRQLLAFARKQTAIPKILDLNDTISGTLKMLRRLIREEIDLFWIPGLDLWKVKIDPSQVDQILANLVVNARDAISSVGVITLRTENVVIDDSNRAETPESIPGEYVLLTVSDTGAGMSKEVRENIFEPFFTTKELGKGTGLGLSTVYGIVKQNDGFIYVASEPGKGTTFKIYLPRFEAETAQDFPEKPAGKSPTGTETILLVEDDEAILNLGKTILENLGYTVLAAPTPGYAIHLAREHPGDIHLLITDVVMPEMNGRELAEELGVFLPNLKCLYMSGYTADVIAHRGILEEGVNFIQKPFGSEKLAERVRQVLDDLE
jgi:PAS domain S-box-containing protein